MFELKQQQKRKTPPHDFPKRTFRHSKYSFVVVVVFCPWTCN